MHSESDSAISRRGFISSVGVTAIAGANLAAAETEPPEKPKTGQKPPRPKPGEKVRVGVVGGNFGCAFFWHLHPNSVVTAVCDIRDEALKRMTERFQCGNTYKNFLEMLKHPELDAVAVFTPAPLHVWMAIQAMKAGKHVISAVPAGMTADELEELLDCVKTTGMKYMMAETSRFHREILYCRDMKAANEFGDIFYAEAEYHHEGLLSLYFDDRGLPTWRHGLAPMHYPTHCTGMILPVMGERLVEVTAIGWGDNHEVLKTNQYKNPFWNTTGFFKTETGRSCRISVCWHLAAGGTERFSLYGDRGTFIMHRPEGSPDTVSRISKEGKTSIDANGYPEGEVNNQAVEVPDYFDRLPEPLRVPSGHGGSHTHITHEFISAIMEDRDPAVDVYEAIAYTLPGIVAHQSALRGGSTMRIRDYGKAKPKEEKKKA
jgi:predicted dehydrogenase